MARHLLGISEDITVKRALEDRLRQAQKMDRTGKFAAGIAHDFNNLLSVILNCAELATDALQAGDPVREELAEIARAGSRAAELTHQLLAFTRAQALPARTVDLNQVIAGMATALAAAAWPV